MQSHKVHIQEMHFQPPDPKSCKTLQWNCSKASRCTFFGDWKNSCSSKFVQLESLNRAKARTSKSMQIIVLTKQICASQIVWTLFKNMQSQGPCSLRLCILRPYCDQNSANLTFIASMHGTQWEKSIFQVHWFLKRCLHDLCLTQKLTFQLMFAVVRLGGLFKVQHFNVTKKIVQKLF